MIKVMLLDDELWELRGLKTMLPWEKHGFTVLSALGNPLEALEILQKEAYDVLFSDIRMPALDGISLIKKIRELNLDTEVIFVSGYAEFEYAQEALRAGAYDYLLKPVDLELTDSLLLRLKNHLEAKRQIKLLQLMDAITNCKLSFTSLFSGIDETYTCQAVMGGPLLASCFESRKDIASFCIPYEHDCLVCFFAYRKGFVPHSFLEQKFPKQPLGLSLPLSGREVDSPDGLSRLLAQAFAAYHSLFFLRPASLYLYEASDRDILHSIDEAFQALFKNGKIQELQQFLNALPDTLRGASVNVNGMVRLWNQLMLTVNPNSDLYDEACLVSAEQMLEQYPDVNHLIRKLRRFLDNQAESDPGSTEENNEIYCAMIAYIRQHFKESLTLYDVADHVHVTFTYASRLFKKYGNTNYSKYLTGLRMDLACRLLTDSDKSTEEICYEIGYNDYFYFNKTFKKHTGQTPLQYRRK